MKIVIIGPAYPFRGGIADTNEALCRTLQQKGHETRIVTFTLQYPELFFPGKTQYSADPRPENLRIEERINSVNPLTWIQTARHINQIAPDLLIIRYWIPFLSPCLGTIAHLVKKRTRIVGMTDNIIPHEKRTGDKWLTQYFLKACHGFITLSSTVKEELESFTRKPSVYFPHPINDNLGEQIGQHEARDHLNLDREKKYILFFGIVRKYKGLDLLLKALGEDKLKKEGIKLLIVGEFYEKTSVYNELIDTLGLSEQVIIINKFIPSAHIRYYFCASDLVAQTYHTASQSGITQIAYHFEKPMLVTNVGGLSEMVPHKKVGYVVEKNPSAISEAISDFFDNNRSDEFAPHIREEKKKYSWDAFIEELIGLYKRL